MHLVAISNHLQIYGDGDGGRLMLINRREKDFAFRRVMFSREEVETIKQLLESLSVEDAASENEK